MIKFTLDTNCVVDVDVGRPNAIFVKKIAGAHLRAEADVCIVAMMASEKQKSGSYLTSFTEFSEKLKLLELSHLGLTFPLCYFDISFWNCCILSGPDLSALEEAIHDVLFPEIEFNYLDFCNARNLDPDAALVGQAHKWRNAKCDVQAIWSHINGNRDVFVTSDGNFLKSKRQQLLDLGARQVLSPSEAASLLP